MPFDNTPTKITVDTPVSLLIEAGIKLIAKPKHWCRKRTEMRLPDGGKAYCALGAVRAATVLSQADDALNAAARAVRAANDGKLMVLSQADDALNAAAGNHFHLDIAALNDDARTTHAMVIEVMREAAEIARGRHVSQ